MHAPPTAGQIGALAADAGAGGALSGNYPNPGLNAEAVQDLVGAMVSGNAETGISVTYDDTNGKLDFSVTGFDPAGTAAGLVDDLSGVTNAATALTNLGFSTYFKTLLASADAATLRGLIGLVLGTDVQAHSSRLDDLAATTAATLLATLGVYTIPFGTAAGDWIDLSGQIGSGVNNSSLHTSTANSDGAAVYVPFTVDASWRQIDALQIDIRTAATSGNVRLGIHADNAGRPGSVVQDASTASVATPGVKTLTFTAITLAPGRYWAVAVMQGLTGTNPTVSTINTSRGAAPWTSPTTGGAALPYFRTATGHVSSTLAANPTVGVVAATWALVPIIRARFA